MRSKSAFTLIELVLYIALAAVILFGASSMMSLIFNARTKDFVVNEVEQQGDLALQTITQSIRNATAVNTPAAGATSGSLSINTTISGNDPTVFSLSTSSIFMKEGTAAAIALTNSNVAITSLNFQNLAQTGAHANLRVSFTVSYNSSSTQQVYQYSRNFYGGGSLRQ